MSKTTANLGLIKPELTDAADITNTNVNWDIIDEQLKDNGDRLDDYGNKLDDLSDDMISHEHLSNGFPGVIKCYDSINGVMIFGGNTASETNKLTPGFWLVTAKNATTLNVYLSDTIYTANSITGVFTNIPLPAVILIKERSLDKNTIIDIASGSVASSTLNSDGETYTISKSRYNPNYTYGTSDFKVGYPLETGKLYFVYE